MIVSQLQATPMIPSILRIARLGFLSCWGVGRIQFQSHPLEQRLHHHHLNKEQILSIMRQGPKMKLIISPFVLFRSRHISGQFRRHEDLRDHGNHR